MWGMVYSKKWALLFLDTDNGYEENKNRIMRVEEESLVLVDSREVTSGKGTEVHSTLWLNEGPKQRYLVCKL